MSRKLTLKEAVNKVVLPQILGAVIGSALAIGGVVPGLQKLDMTDRLERIAKEDPRVARGLAETLAGPTDSCIANLFGYGSMKAAREYLENAGNKKE